MQAQCAGILRRSRRRHTPDVYSYWCTPPPCPSPPLVLPQGGGGVTCSTQNSIAFGKSTSQRIYTEQHVPKIGWKLHKYGLKHALHTFDGHFR